MTKRTIHVASSWYYLQSSFGRDADQQVVPAETAKYSLSAPRKYYLQHVNKNATTSFLAKSSQNSRLTFHTQTTFNTPVRQNVAGFDANA
jgi:hypothetical protein